MTIAFVGAGRWAMTLALVLYRKGYQIRMWEYCEERINLINRTKKISELPDTISIPEQILITSDLEKVFDAAELIFFAVPSQVLRNVLIKITPFRFCKNNNGKAPILISAMKGLENNTHKRMSQIIKEFYPHLRICVLAGPGIPYEIAEGKPASLVIASNDNNVAHYVQDVLSTENLRIYAQSDLVGTELGGALKNVIAIACGICDGLHLGDNAKAAVLTRGLTEITRIGIAFNANPMTFAGLAGIGDVTVTSYSQYSRNRQYGEKIGQDFGAKQAVLLFNGVIEGIATTITAKKIGNKLRLELPIINEIFEILFNEAEIKKSIKKLMSRPLKNEMIYEV